MENQLYRFVEASERLPNEDGIYNCKYFNETASLNFNSEAKFFFIDGHGNPSYPLLSLIEWLEPVNSERSKISTL